MAGNYTHGGSTGLNVHVAHRFQYADAAARAAATGLTADDALTLALQLDDHSLWLLTDHDPPTWARVGSGGGGGEADAPDDRLDYTEATDLIDGAAWAVDVWHTAIPDKAFAVAGGEFLQVNLIGAMQLVGGGTCIATAHAVIDAAGTPIRRVLGTVARDGGGFLGLAGSFALRGLAAGDHTIRVEVRHTGGLSPRSAYLRALTQIFEGAHIDITALQAAG